MDIASIIGFVGTLILMVYGMVDGKGFGVITDTFVNLPSALITFGGSFGTVLAMNPVKDFVSGIKSFALVLKVPKSNEAETIKTIIELSNLARREGLLALEESANSLDDDKRRHADCRWY